MRPGRFPALLALPALLAGGGARSTAAAAHEWRAAWGAPHPFVALDERLLGRGEGLRAGLALARPFGVPGLSFGSAWLRGVPAGWEAHAGSLRAGAYGEGHFGAGRRQRIGGQASLLLGARLFVLEAGEEWRSAHLGATALLGARFLKAPAVELEAGAVDLPLGGAREGPDALLISRLAVAAGERRVVVEHALRLGGGSATTWAAAWPLGRLRLVQMLRAGTGEGGLSAYLRAGRLELGVGQRWHPQLGWTPVVSVSWMEEF